MTHVSTIFLVEDLEQQIAEGWVRYQSNTSDDYRIYNYTEKTQFAKHWNPVTLACRGLILDRDYNIIARPWKKFFNYGEGRLAIDDTMPVEVTDKMDGSLGILYPANGGPVGMYTAIATRGSFLSEQALHASRLFNAKYASEINFESIFDYTFLFEIVYPENRIVLDYAGMDDLVLLGAVQIERGYYLGPREAAGILNWTGPVTQVFEARTMAEAFAMPPRPNAEGVVVRSGTEMVKIKQVDYVELHRIVTNLSPKSIWSRMVAGDTLETLAEFIPDEWHGWMKETYARIDEQFQSAERRILSNYMDALDKSGYLWTPDRKAFARVAQKSPDKRYMFMLLDQKPIAPMIWQEVMPKGNEEEDARTYSA